MKDGNVVYSRSFGYRQINGSEKKPLTAANRFRIASITKMFTAAMILQLVEEGKLKVTDTLDKSVSPADVAVPSVAVLMRASIRLRAAANTASGCGAGSNDGARMVHSAGSRPHRTSRAGRGPGCDGPAAPRRPGPAGH